MSWLSGELGIVRADGVNRIMCERVRSTPAPQVFTGWMEVPMVRLVMMCICYWMGTLEVYVSADAGCGHESKPIREGRCRWKGFEGFGCSLCDYRTLVSWTCVMWWWMYMGGRFISIRG